MEAKVIDNQLVIALVGRIDTNNAAQVEKEILGLLAENAGKTPVFDAAGLEYISSAGLRVVMKVRKQAKKSIRVENVSPEVYEIFETTGFTGILEVQKALRQVSVEGCELIGSGGFGRVYRTDPETIVKVYNPGISLEEVRSERDTAQSVFLLGVPTAISYDVVRCGECYGVVYELLDAKTVAQIIDADPSRLQEMGQKSAKLLRQLHQIEVGEGKLPSREATMLEWLDKIAPYLEPSEVEGIRSFILSIPKRSTFLHGDYNSKNIMVQGDEFVLIDLGDATVGHPVFDVAGLVLPYLYLPNAPSLSAEEKRRLLGFPMEEAPKMWGVMCATYFGLTDPSQVETMASIVMPYAQMISSYQGARRAGFQPDYMRSVNIPGLRQRLLPLIRNAKPEDLAVFD